MEQAQSTGSPVVSSEESGYEDAQSVKSSKSAKSRHDQSLEKGSNGGSKRVSVGSMESVDGVEDGKSIHSQDSAAVKSPKTEATTVPTGADDPEITKIEKFSPAIDTDNEAVSSAPGHEALKVIEDTESSSQILSSSHTQVDSAAAAVEDTPANADPVTSSNEASSHQAETTRRASLSDTAAFEDLSSEKEQAQHQVANDLAPPPSLEPPTALPKHRSSDTSSLSSAADLPRAITPVATEIYGVVLVGFNHALGPIVDYSFPAHLKEDEDIAKSLPFLALPDGAHMHDEDYSCFHLFLPNISSSTVYGIACVRQIRADELLRRANDVTRSTVQKAVVVLANRPIFGPIRDKLGVITRAFFAQRDFEETEILEHFHHSLIHALQDEEQTDENAINMGMSVRELIWKFRMQTLTLFKLMLLQKRVMFYGLQVERLCTFQYALVSLVPLLLLHLEDAASPLLDSRGGSMDKATSLRSSDRRSLLRYLGLPLHLYGKGAFFQPYLPLQQMELLRSESYLVGATNSIFQSQRDCLLDVVVNLETGNIEYLNPKIAGLVGLTAADRKWMDEIVRAVENSWNPADPHRPMDMGYKASDDWIRSKFEEYVTSVLSAIKFVDFLTRNQDMSILVNPNDPSGLGSFNESWIAAFRSTPAFDLWNRHTDPVIFDLVEPKHPCEGQAHVIEDVGIRLANGLHDLHLDEKLGPTQEAISKGLATGSEGVWKLYSSVRSDLAKRQAEFRERREREESRKASADVTDADVNATPGGQRDEQTAQQPLFSDHVLAGAAEVSGRAANLASNLGSFFGSRLNKARAQTTSPVPSQSAPSSSVFGSVEAETQSPSTGTSGEAASPRTRPSIFSSFRAPSVMNVQSAKSLDNSTLPAQPIGASKANTSLPSPPVSSFSSFFRRPSAAPPRPPSPPDEDEMVIIPVDVTHGRRSSTEVPVELASTASVWGGEQKSEEENKSKLSHEPWKEHVGGRKSTSSTKSDVLSDVNL